MTPKEHAMQLLARFARRASLLAFSLAAVALLILRLQPEENADRGAVEEPPPAAAEPVAGSDPNSGDTMTGRNQRPNIYARLFPDFELEERRVYPLDGAKRWREVALCRDPGDAVLPLKRVESIAYLEDGELQLERSFVMAGNRFAVEIVGEPDAVSSRIESIGLELGRALPFSPVVTARFEEPSIDRFDTLFQLLQVMEKEGLIRCSADYLASPSLLPDDPQYAEKQADLDLVDAPGSWEVTTGSVESVVVVIDSGIQLDHPDLAANLFLNPGEIADNGIDDDGNGLVDDVSGWDFHADDAVPDDVVGHGTSMAGIIAAVGDNGIGVAGTAWNASLVALKAGDDFLPWSSIIQAVDYAIWLKATGVPVVAINASFAGAAEEGEERDLLYQAMERALAADLLVVAAAGNTESGGKDNDASPLQRLYPSDFDLDNILSVAATDQSDALAPTSNYGQVSVDMAAPGVSVFTTTKASGYTSLSGTSCSSARVCGAAILLHSLNSNLGSLQLKSILIDQSAVAVDLLGKLKHPARLDMAAAVEEARRYPLVAWTGGEDTIYVREGDSVALQADASSFDSQIERVEWYRGDVLLASDNDGSDGWQFPWIPAAGNVSLRMRAVDIDARSVDSTGRLLRVLGDFDFWRYEVWGPDFDSIATSAADSDPDGDGLSNFLEYSILGTPLEALSAADRSGRPTARFIETAGELALEISFRVNMPISYTRVSLVQFNAEEPGIWIEASPRVEEEIDPEFSDARQITYRVEAPLGLSLYRIRFNRTP